MCSHHLSQHNSNTGAAVTGGPLTAALISILVSPQRPTCANAFSALALRGGEDELGVFSHSLPVSRARNTVGESRAVCAQENNHFDWFGFHLQSSVK